MDVGSIQTVEVIGKKDDYYLVNKGIQKKRLYQDEATRPLTIGDRIEVFVFSDRVSMQLPHVTVGQFDWVTVDRLENDRIYVDIGSSQSIAIYSIDLPAFRAVWPRLANKLYVTLKVKRDGELFAVPAKERQFAHLIEDASQVELNDRLSGYVIRTAREGTVLLSEEGYRGFIHHSEREVEPCLGDYLTARVIEVKEDGSLNMSLKPLKHERIDQDAQVILDYLIEQGGQMPFSDRSDPNEIRESFQMSKSAFKRALGRLMREGKVGQKPSGSFLIKP